MSVGRAAPVRTCVGCRQRAASSDLLRVVVAEGRLVADPRRRRPGRGAHLHPSRACLDLAVRRRAFARALHVAGTVDAGELVGFVASQGQRGNGGTGTPAPPHEQESRSDDMSAR